MEQIDLSGFFTTKAQSADFSTRLANVSALVYDTSFDLEKILLEQLGVQKKDKFITLLRHSSIPLNSNTAIKTFIGQIQDKIASLTVLTLTIAFEPKAETLRAISEWFLVNTNKQVLLDIQIDSKLIAGAVISVNGKFFDYSVRPKFENVLKGVMASTPQTPFQPTTYTPLTGHQSIEHLTLGR